MWTDFRRMGLTELSHRLDLEPFEAVRLVVASGKPRDVLTFDQAVADEVGAFGGVERWWSDLQAPADGSDARKALFQACLARMLSKGLTGDHRTRQDNLWRGLPRPLREFLKDAIEVLIEENVLHLRADATGLLISIRNDAADRARAMSEGREIPEDLRKLWS
jgi:hypothetical protein